MRVTTAAPLGGREGVQIGLVSTMVATVDQRVFQVFHYINYIDVILGPAEKDWGGGVADHIVCHTAQSQPNPAPPREVMTPGLLKIPGLQVRSFQPNGNLQGHRKPELV
jgi:hypothetical protein